MRVIGQLQNEPSARRFSDYLLTRGIDNQIDSESNGAWKIWVLAEEQIEAAQTLLRSYCENPGDPKYLAATQAARAQAEQRGRDQAAAEKKHFDRKRLFSGKVQFGILTVILIVACVAVGLLTGLGDDINYLKHLFISQFDMKGGGYLARLQGLPEIKHGQVWRLFTPMFIHFGEMHLLFNMLNFYFLGTAIEQRQSSRLLAALILVIAGLSNFGQYLAGGPTFGGMSGVVYGLFGYIWIRNRFDPGFGLQLNKQSVIIMVVWFFLCLVGFIPHVANTAHGVGFGVGMAWGFISAKIANRST